MVLDIEDTARFKTIFTFLEPSIEDAKKHEEQNIVEHKIPQNCFLLRIPRIDEEGEKTKVNIVEEGKKRFWGKILSIHKDFRSSKTN